MSKKMVVETLVVVTRKVAQSPTALEKLNNFLRWALWFKRLFWFTVTKIHKKYILDYSISEWLPK